MTGLFFTICIVVLASFVCSLMESALYAIPWTFIENLRSKGSKTGKILCELRGDISKPIAAILTLNTIANTAGATLAGAIADRVLGHTWAGVIAGILTLLILAFGEIVPKTLGVVFSEKVGVILSRPLLFLTFVFTPFIWASSLLTRTIAKPGTEPVATEDDIRALVRLSRKSGAIQPDEEKTIGNVLSFNDKHVSDIMTPRTVVVSLPENMTVSDAYHQSNIWNFSRIPIYADDNEDIVGVVMVRNIVKAFADDEDLKTMHDLMKPVHFILENQPLDTLLRDFLQSHQHLFVVLDEYGGLAGVVTLEDAVEELLGKEIVDESDTQTDMRAIAKSRKKNLIAGYADAEKKGR